MEPSPSNCVKFSTGKRNNQREKLYIFDVLGVRRRVCTSNSTEKKRRKKKQDLTLTSNFFFYTPILLFIAILANGLPHPEKGALPQSLCDCIILFHLQRRGDGMIKQRPCRYPWLLLTCDLRCATFTLKYNADWVGLFLLSFFFSPAPLCFAFDF